MSQQLLDHPNVIAILKQMSGKRVPVSIYTLLMFPGVLQMHYHYHSLYANDISYPTLLVRWH